MVFTDAGIEQIQLKGIQNVSAETPLYVSFCGSDNTFTGTETSLNNEFIRKAVTWQSSGIQSKYTVELTSTEAVGSIISALGLVGGPNIGSNTLFAIDASFIGSKNNTFSAQVEGEIIIRRPL